MILYVVYSLKGFFRMSDKASLVCSLFCITFHFCFFKGALNIAMSYYCPTECTTMGINFGIPIRSTLDIGKNEAYMKLYFKNLVNVRTSIYSYSISSLIADIGGYLGLLLGFSVLDLTHLFKTQFFVPSWMKLMISKMLYDGKQGSKKIIPELNEPHFKTILQENLDFHKKLAISSNNLQRNEKCRKSPFNESK